MPDVWDGANGNPPGSILAGALDARTPGGPGSTTDVSYYIDNIVVLAPPSAAAVTVPTFSDFGLLAFVLLLAAFGARVYRKS